MDVGEILGWIWGIGIVVLWIPFSFVVPRCIDGTKWSKLEDPFFKFMSLALGALASFMWPLTLTLVLLYLGFAWFARFGLGRKIDVFIDRFIP